MGRCQYQRVYTTILLVSDYITTAINLPGLTPVSPFINFSDDSTPTPSSKLQNLDNTSLTRHKYHTMVTCSGNSAGNSMEIPRKYHGNSTDKQPQNKDSLTKGYKTESRKDTREIQRKKTCLNLSN